MSHQIHAAYNRVNTVAGFLVAKIVDTKGPSGGVKVSSNC